MCRYYLRIAFRQLLGNRLFSFINVFGLAVGTAACMIIFQYVNFETSYDDFHKNGDHIYRVVFTNYTNGKFEGRHAYTVAGLGPAVREAFSQEVVFARVTPKQKTIVSYDPPKSETIRFFEERLAYVDGNFLQIFSFPLTKGNAQTVLSKPGTVIISESTAKKYFKAKEPLGQLLNIGEGEAFLVEGVFKDFPENSWGQLPATGKTIPAGGHTIECTLFHSCRCPGDNINFITRAIWLEVVSG